MEILQVLPIKVVEMIKEKVIISEIQEIRIKINKPVIINISNDEVVLDYVISKEELKYIITKISNYSLYAFEEEMRQGYITFKGGHRIGLAGQCVMEEGTVKVLRNICSINIRIC